MNIGDIPESWQAPLEPVLNGAAGAALRALLEGAARRGETIYPPQNALLRALELTPLDQVKAVILGQDPYHGPGQAMGLAFSVPRGVRPPPSLKNIFKELQADRGIAPPAHGDLTAWARQGVLLLNTSLSVAAGAAGSHAGKGWEAVTGAVLGAVAAREAPAMFILWGNHADAAAARVPSIAAGQHGVIRSAHPSPLSAQRGFFGSRPFGRTDAFLEKAGRGAVDWRL
ncbi:uracil-DNA glycosylase [Qipengyuania sediminis]|uniref:uracil-DNA glycosylase n=1 Tax=Qipengyuania sediminis TaxID=1532023 RepID=UPI001F0D0B5A|nr:uracil-DNA glycosylase [Qipengyuania sediminis]